MNGKMVFEIYHLDLSTNQLHRNQQPFVSDGRRTARVTYTNELSNVDTWILTQKESILRRGYIGLDLEWKPTRRVGEYHPTALIQLAVDSDVLLFHIFHSHKWTDGIGRSAFEQLQGSQLGRLLKSSVLKVGCGVVEDGKKLNKDFQLEVNSAVDLAALCREHYRSTLIELWSPAILREFDQLASVLTAPALLLALQQKCGMPPVTFISPSHSACLSLWAQDQLSSSTNLQHLLGWLQLPDVQTFIKNERKQNKPAVEQVSVQWPSYHSESSFQLPHPPHRAGFGLKKAAEIYLGKVLPCGRITQSNWERLPLDMKQITYAALDAWAGFHIFRCLCECYPKVIPKGKVEF